MTEGFRCLLITPPERKPDKNRFTSRELGQEGVFPPLGLAYIAAFLRKNGVEVKIIDSLALALTVEEVVREAALFRPDLIGITVLTQQYTQAVKLSAALKKEISAPVVLGGIHVFAEHLNILKEEPTVDYCVRGEGEHAMMELVEAVAGGRDMRSIKGLSYRDGENVAANPERGFIENLDTVPFPARELLPMDMYRGTIALDGGTPFSTILATRGCPFSCQYCELATMWKTQRRRSVENVLDEMEHLKKTYGVRYLEFVDDLLVAHRKWAIELCNGIRARGLDDMEWECCGRIGLMTEELLRAMKSANCRCVSYGIEFGSQRMLDFVNKKITLKQIHETIDLTNRVGVPVKGLFMMGYPTETREEIEETIRLAKSLKLDYMAVSIVTPYPGTELYKYCKKNGLLMIDGWHNYDVLQLRQTAIKHDNVTLEELLEYSIKINQKFLLRPSYMMRMLWRHPRKALVYGPKLLGRLFSA